MNSRLRKLWDSLRASYWFVPSLMIVLAFIFWVLTSTVDRVLSASDALPISWLYYDEIDSMRTLVLTITGTIIGVIGVVYSITMIPLTIAASQFGPRLLRNFLRDRGTQFTLGTFTATFVFCLLVQVQLRDVTARPQVSVNGALFLGLCSFLILIYFINHVAVSIQASKVVAEVSEDLLKAIDRELPEALGGDSTTLQPLFGVPEGSTGRTVTALRNGYVQVRDDAGLLRTAKERDVVIQLLSEPGDFVVAGTALAVVWPDTAASDELDEVINDAFILGIQRTLVQDTMFGINELVEVALRALSPAINDPFTAMTCLDWLGTALCRLCGRSFPSGERLDDSGKLRLLSRPFTFTQMADAALNQIREYGRGSTAVTLRIMHLLEVVAQCVRTEEQRKALLHHAVLVERGSRLGLSEPSDQQKVDGCYQRLVQLLGAGSFKKEVL